MAACGLGESGQRAGVNLLVWPGGSVDEGGGGVEGMERVERHHRTLEPSTARVTAKKKRPEGRCRTTPCGAARRDLPNRIGSEDAEDLQGDDGDERNAAQPENDAFHDGLRALNE